MPRMDAPLLPVLSVWTVDGRSPSPVPTALERVPGNAATAQDALARARQQFPGRDVLLLRGDAVLPPDAVDRLLAAWADPAWDVLSPLDGRWTLVAEPLDDAARDALAWVHGEHAAFAWADWSPVCSLWRGAALGASTSPGAGRSALLPCLWVGPADPGGAAAPMPLPLVRLAERIGQAEHRPAVSAEKPTVLHVLHGWGGGAARFVRDLAAGDRERNHLVLVAHSGDDRPPFGKRLALHLDIDAPPLRQWPLSEPIADTAIHSAEVQAVLAEVLPQWRIGAVLVSSLIGHSLDVLRTGLPTAICTHDAYPLWPLLHDARDPGEHAFDVTTLAAELERIPQGHSFVFSRRDAGQWWELREAFVAAVADGGITFVAPSEFARRRLCAIAPALSARAWQVIPHGLAPFAAPAPARPPRPADAPLRVLVPGRLDGGKGEHLIAAMLDSLPPGIELILLGCGHAADRFAGRPGLQVQRDYRRDELPSWIERLAPDLALLPSTVPETFSYTLSEMLALGLPVLGASPGAPAERLRAGGGWGVAPDAAAVNAMLSRLAADRDLLQVPPAPPPADLAAMAASWRRALDIKPTPLRLPAADPQVLARLALESEAAAQHRRLVEGDSALAQADAELQRRADWAFALDREVAKLGERNARLEQQLAHSRDQHDQEIARLGEYILQLDHQLAEAHGYYQRDSTDLARQRDVAIRQRDDAVTRLARIEESHFWRLTALPRWLLGGLRGYTGAMVYHARHLRSLASRGLASLRSRGLRHTLQRLRERRRVPGSIDAAPNTRASGERPLRLPRPSRPRASIVVPAYNHLPVSLACLRALADSGDQTSFEVILVDDASSDSTPQVLPGIPGLRYHRNPHNLGFIGACNAGAEMARGEFLVFLNNDTTVQPGWLDALLATFDTHPDTGLAGSKLVYPDGRLQEAGGIVFADGSGWNYGRFEDPAHPRFNFVREVDYCSGASIALRRDLFLNLGGFDSHYAPAYYEDTDLAMRVREKGLKVRYQPASVVVHHEGISSGTDLNSGVKAYQVVNQKKFLARWGEVLARSHAPAGQDAGLASERGRIHQVLLLDACTPTPDRDSGSVRMLALLRLLRECGCAVAFFPENRAHDGAYTEALQQLGIEAWWHPHLGDVPRWLARHGRRFDTVIVSRHYVLSPLLPLLRLHAPQATIVFDTVDLHHLREQREAELSGDPAQQRVAARTRKVELGLIAQSDRTWVVSEAEKTLLAKELPEARVDVVSNIHDVRGAGPSFEQRAGLLFVGGYRHTPNVDAALWLANDILPRIRERLPDVELHLVGGDAPESVAALGALPGVTFHGYVPDLEPLLGASRVGLAPLRYGAGVKGKVNQSLAHGLPVVATRCAVEGMHLVDGEDVLVADDAEAFAEHVVRLHSDAVLWQRLAQGGLENTRRYFSAEPVRATLRELFGTPPAA
ncbi:glycosyltransferase [Arenimonas terrae]|uniref:Glycosyltransferase n=2 Tax=Arenimonas terrae TaxID=2546226 RepID=A0A5C4RWZ5_9GAMM|nr:glycosyltransferase [Arenimonas terrae]